METEKEDNTESIKIVPAISINFDRKNDLIKTLKKIDKSVDKSIEFLEQVMLNSENELKVRVDCAKTILDKKIQISDSINKDNLSRLISQSRLLMAERAVQQKRIKDVGNEDDDEGYSTPQYLPSVILNNENIRSM